MDMEQFLSLLLTIVAGAGGYLIVTFWFQPILRYREIKYRVVADLIFFANARDLENQNGDLRDDTLKRMESNRRCASELEAIYSDRPRPYRCWLQCRKENPKKASEGLIGLSNSTTWRDAEPFEKSVKENLKFSG